MYRLLYKMKLQLKLAYRRTWMKPSITVHALFLILLAIRLSELQEKIDKGEAKPGTRTIYYSEDSLYPLVGLNVLMFSVAVSVWVYTLPFTEKMGGLGQLLMSIGQTKTLSTLSSILLSSSFLLLYNICLIVMGCEVRLLNLLPAVFTTTLGIHIIYLLSKSSLAFKITVSMSLFSLFGYYITFLSPNTLAQVGTLPFCSLLSLYALGPRVAYDWESNAYFFIAGIAGNIVQVVVIWLLNKRDCYTVRRVNAKCDESIVASCNDEPLIRETADQDSIQVNSLTKKFGPKAVLSSISTKINLRSTTCLLGKAESGKSTLLKCILGFERPSEGDISIPVQARIGFLPQTIAFCDSLSVEEHLDWAWNNYARVDPNFKKTDKEFQEKLAKLNFLMQSGLWKQKVYNSNSKTHEYTEASKKLVSLAMILLTEPDMLILDDLTSSLGLLHRSKILNNLYLHLNTLKSGLIYSSSIPVESSVPSRLIYLDQESILIDRESNELERDKVVVKIGGVHGRSDKLQTYEIEGKFWTGHGSEASCEINLKYESDFVEFIRLLQKLENELGYQVDTVRLSLEDVIHTIEQESSSKNQTTQDMESKNNLNTIDTDSWMKLFELKPKTRKWLQFKVVFTICKPCLTSRFLTNRKIDKTDSLSLPLFYSMASPRYHLQNARKGPNNFSI